jgi:hypothetical protein
LARAPKGNYRHGSDIDIAALEERIDDLLVPYQIDLYQVESVENAALLAHIERIGQPLYPASCIPHPERFADPQRSSPDPASPSGHGDILG